MIELEKFLKFIHQNGDNITKTKEEDEYLNLISESLIDSLFLSLTNKIRKDPGNYYDLDYLAKIKRDISKESRKQYKIIISFSKSEKRNDVITALEKYNILHFLKFVNKILEIDNDYNYKVNQCKHYFKNSLHLSIVEKLYKQENIPFIELKQLANSDLSLLDKSSQIYDLIVTKKEGDSEIYSLTSEGKNLYAFFMMKEIKLDDFVNNYNESKVNEVLEYLINYLLTESSHNRHTLKKPLLHSASANINLKNVTALIDQKDNYKENIVQRTSNYGSDYYNWKGSNLWKN